MKLNTPWLEALFLVGVVTSWAQADPYYLTQPLPPPGVVPTGTYYHPGYPAQGGVMPVGAWSAAPDAAACPAEGCGKKPSWFSKFCKPAKPQTLPVKTPCYFNMKFHAGLSVQCKEAPTPVLLFPTHPMVRSPRDFWMLED